MRVVFQENPTWDAALSLAWEVSKAHPTYLPPVTAGTLSIEAWFFRKRLNSTFEVWDNDVLVGFGGLRTYDLLPSGAAAGREEEFCRLMTKPAYQGRGVASAIIGQVKGNVWATAHKGGKSHRLFSKAGWRSQPHEVSWSDDPLPGVLLYSPTP